MHSSDGALTGKRVLVVGLGLQGGGVGVVRYLVRRGAQVTVTDLKGEDQLRPSLQALAGLPVKYILGTNDLPDLESYDLLVRNPAVPLQAPIMKRARDLGIEITMEMNLFFRDCRAKIVGVTGTKGKSTTASLTAHLLAHKFSSVVFAGNVGISALDQLERCGPEAIVVLELSSWQLEGLGSQDLSPDLAIITRIFPDHMDAYATFDEYLEAKLQIVRHQNSSGCLVVSRDDAYWERFALESRGKVVTYSITGGPADVWVERGALWARGIDGLGVRVASLEDWKLVGSHNLSNLAGAAAAALELGLSGPDIEAGISSFEGLPHRLEVVGEVDGVKYVDDSSATIPEAAAAAVRSFGPERVVLVCGGSDKGLDPSPLAEVAVRCKAVGLLEGSGTPRLAAALEALGSPALKREFSSLEDALAWSSSVAQRGDVVLLSPGFASFGMFVNYRERGDRLRTWVQARMAERHT